MKMKTELYMRMSDKQMEKLLKKTKKPTTKEEKELWAKFYKLAQGNGWATGRYARADGDFISEDDCLNENSCSVIYDLEVLRAAFIHGNWCLGQSWLYLGGKYPICFTQQIDGGDEWEVARVWADGTMSAFESYTMRPTACEYEPEEEFRCYSKDKKKVDGSYFKYVIQRLTSIKSRKEYVDGE